MALRNAVAKFNETQKQSVRDLGFGALLHLDIKDVPPKIAYWVLDNFDTKRCEIVLEGDRRVRVGEDNDRLIFGFPRGPHPILRKVKNAEVSLSKEWWERFTDVNCRKILAKNVCDAAVEEVDGGTWFKRHFMVLMTCCLIESIGNSYVSSQILDNFREVDRVANLDWCNYVIKCLVEHTTVWQKSKDKFYTGPSLFITMLYMDRVVLGYRRVPRSIPAINEWKDKILLRRQNLEIEDGGFGNGFCSGPCTEAEVVAAGDDHEPVHVAAGDEAGGARAEAQPDDDHIAALLEIEAAALRRDELKRHLDGPSFSLGFTQDWAGVMNATEEQAPGAEHAQNEISISTPIDGNLISVLGEHAKESGCNEYKVMENIDIVTNESGAASMDVGEKGAVVANVATKTNKTGDKMTIRAKNESRKTNVLVSPYLVRPIVASEKLSMQQKKLYYWIMRNEEANFEEVVYFDSKMEFRRRELLTLAPGEYLSSAILDVWSVIMNHNEKLRGPDSPRRFFSTTYPCLGTAVTVPATWDYARRSSTFSSRLLSEINNVDGLHLANIEMCKGEIIDNSSALDWDGVDPLLKYGDVSDIMRLKMPWRNDTNKVDCSIYVMRHMETYKGGSLRHWNSGLTSDNAKQMKYLRAKYCAVILNDESNIHKERIMADASLYYRATCGDGPHNIDAIVMNNV
ncbi:hypothetical protein C2S51_019927 [Perilla frutescens var. frutescens]|nr:hypothetical protein C2S51_019927 [Perilla frutescens var. frutescens]